MSLRTIYRDNRSHVTSIAEGRDCLGKIPVTIDTFYLVTKQSTNKWGKITSLHVKSTLALELFVTLKVTKFYSSTVTCYFYSVTGQLITAAVHQRLKMKDAAVNLLQLVYCCCCCY